MKRLMVLAMVALSLPGGAWAQAAPQVAAGDTLLTLNAEGKSTRIPDIAAFNAGITTLGQTASASVAANAATMTRVIDALRAAGVADRDVQTANLSLNPVFAENAQGDGNPPRITGYRASNNVAVRARDVARTGRIVDALVAAGANEVSGPNFELDQPDAALDEARSAAMASARQRAELYARAAGLKVLRIVAINENPGNDSNMIMVTARRMSAIAVPTPVAAGEVAMSVHLTVQFELAPQ